MSASSAPPVGRRVLIAGGGIAGVEAALAVRAFAGDLGEVLVIDPGRRVIVPGTAPGRAFGMGEGIDLRLADVVDRAGATLLGGRVAAVDAGRHIAALDGGELVSYDALVLAVGARPLAAVPGALTFAGPGDIEAVRGMVDDISRRALRGAGVEMAFVVPDGCGWPLAAYELALMTREHLEAQDAADPVSISVVTSEDAPLGLFGPDASASVMRSLARARIDVVAGVAARRWGAGRLEIDDGRSLWAARDIALPVYRGPAIVGLPADADGFIPAQEDGRVPGVADVWAVGDGTTNPVKQGGVACRQADAAAAAIAHGFGAAVDDAPVPCGLSAWMWDGRRGRTLPSGRSQDALAWPVAKIGGRFLAPFLRGLVADRIRSGPVGVPS
jgi:sulfide:quinone oxidoreductase